jgi:hypothetical protein
VVPIRATLLAPDAQAVLAQPGAAVAGHDSCADLLQDQGLTDAGPRTTAGSDGTKV